MLDAEAYEALMKLAASHLPSNWEEMTDYGGDPWGAWMLLDMKLRGVEIGPGHRMELSDFEPPPPIYTPNSHETFPEVPDPV